MKNAELAELRGPKRDGEKRLEKRAAKAESELRAKTRKNVELYQRVYWLEEQLKRLLDAVGKGAMVGFSAGTGLLRCLAR